MRRARRLLVEWPNTLLKPIAGKHAGQAASCQRQEKIVLEVNMKTIVFRVALVGALLFGSWQLGQAQATVVDFRITIRPASGGATLECLRGCAWKTLGFTCDGKQDCRAEIDQAGVRSVSR